MGTILAWLPTGADLTDAEFHRRHRLILAVLWIHLPILLIMGVVLGRPLDETLLAVAPVVALATIASVVTGRGWAACTASLGLLAGSAALIQLSGGMIEAHFHIFVILVFVALYQDWRALGITIAFTVVHHIGVSLVNPHGAFDHHAAQHSPVLWALIHAVFVVAEVVGILLFWKVTEEAQAEAKRSGEAVAERDRALAEAEREALGRLADEAARAEDELRRRTEVGATVSRTAAELETTMADVRTGVEAMTGSLGELGASVDAISTAVDRATSVTTQAVERARAADRTVTQLGASSAEVGGVLDVISRIAAQTNLLALNATIEAARAGDAGRGFAVVATEVKDLARQTAEAAVSISRMIEAIQADATATAADLESVVGIIGEIDGIQDEVGRAVAEQTMATSTITGESARVARETGSAGTLVSALLAAVDETGV